MEISEDKAKELLDHFSMDLKNKGINVDKGLFYVNFEYGQYICVMQYIAQEWPGHQEQLVKLQKKGMPEQYAVLVHAVKSNAELLGAAKLKEKALQLENMCKNEQLEGWQEEDAKLRMMMDSVTTCLNVLLSDTKQVNQGEIGYLSDDIYVDYQDKLMRSIEAASAPEATKLLDRILEYRMEPSRRHMYEEVKKSIYKCEYDEAKRILKEMF